MHIHQTRRDDEPLSKLLHRPLDQDFETEQAPHQAHGDAQPLVTPDGAGRDHLDSLQLR